MTEPIRLRIAEINYYIGPDTQRNVRAAPYRVKDQVSISKEAYEKFRASTGQKKQLQQEPDKHEAKTPEDPNKGRNLEALNLDQGARPEEIRKAYLDAVKKYHPDKFVNYPPELVKAAEEKTKQINSAYSLLKKKA
ncbi:hypothetical protein SBDP1_470047 [Syntrophobacter sp. SbD1]|nr:hypothetical protein SBDP1_470047 [Syntrophobacter sp. SbD1]